MEIDGETLAELLAGLDMVWTLVGESYDLEGEMTLDPAEGELGTLTLCLLPGCYDMTFDMQGAAGLDGLPGMTLSLAVGEEEEVEVDLAILEDIELEFGVQTDCGSSVMERHRRYGLALFPNPHSRIQGDVDRSVVGAGLEWTLQDAAGHDVDAVRPGLLVGGGPRRSCAGAYLIEVFDGAQRQVGR